MSAYAGSLLPATSPHVPLILLPLVLILGALVVAFSKGRLEARQRHNAAFVSIGLALGLLALHATQLFTLEASRRMLRDVATNLVRIGSFDANFGFFLDPTAAFFSFVTLGASAFYLTRLEFVKKNADAQQRHRAGLLLLCAGVSTAVLGDGFVGLALGLSLATVATFLLIAFDARLARSAATASRVFVLQNAGNAAILAGFVALFWTLGGAFREDGYLNDFRARFVVVHDRAHAPTSEEVVMPGEAPRGERDPASIAQRAKERGSLTFTSHPGARVFIDVRDKVLKNAEPFAVAPFVRKELPVGAHEAVIVPGGSAIVAGDGYEVAWIERLVVSAGEDVTLVPLGQATTFSEITDQLELVDEEGKHFVRNALFKRTLFGSFSVVSFLVFLATLGGLLLGVPVLLVPWLGGVSSTPAWNALRVSAVVLATYPIVRLQAFVEFRLEIVVALIIVAALIAALVRSRRPSLILGAATIVLLGLQGTSVADEGAGRLVLRSEFGNVVELEYAPDGETMHGAFVIRNEGSKALTITEARLVHSEAVPRIPPFVTVEIDGAKGQPVVIEPGKQRRAIVRWKYAASRAREFQGLAYVEPGEARVGGLVPVHAARPRDLGPWGNRALSFFVGFPLVATLLALLLRGLRRDTPRNLAGASALVFGTLLVFALVVAGRFDNELARADGNEGLQFVERSVWLSSAGIEWFLGLDGISLTFVVLISLVTFLAAIAAGSLRDRAFGFHVFVPLFVTSAMGVFLAQDLFFWCVFWLVGVLAVSGLVLLFAPAERRTKIQFVSFSLAGMVLVGASAYWLHQHSDPRYLVNGEFVVRAWNMPDLARTNWLNLGLDLFGAPGLIVVWSALFVAFVSRLVTMGYVFAAFDAPTAMVIPATWAATAICGLLRLNLGILPLGLKWAATTVLIAGIIMIVVFAGLARLQTKMRSWFGSVATAYAGFVLLGLGSSTPQGITAVVYVGASLVLSLALAALLVATVEERNETGDVARLAGMSQKMPFLAGAFFLTVLVLIGLPGSTGFWGPLLAIVGVFPRQPVLALLAMVAFVFLGAVAVRKIARMFVSQDEKATDTKKSDLGRNELLVFVPLVVLVLGLGFSPRTVFSLLDAVILDLHRLVDAAGSMQVG